MKWTLLFVCMCVPLAAAEGDTVANPLLEAADGLVRYDRLTPDQVGEAVTTTLARFKEDLAAVYGVPATERTYENTLQAYDRAFSRFSGVYGAVYLLANTAPDEALRTACHAALTALEQADNALVMDADLFAAVSQLAATPAGAALSGPRRRFMTDMLDDFRNNGLALPADQQAELSRLRNEMSTLERGFERNLGEYQDALIVNEAAVAGLDEAYKAPRRTEEGHYKIDLSYPSYQPFMRYSPDAAAREALYRKYNNRAPENAAVLKQVLSLRKKMAGLLGYPDYAAYRLSSKMAGSSDNVRRFEDGLIKRLKGKAEKEYQTLLAAKRTELPDADQVAFWDIAYYREKVMMADYRLDQREISKYFDINRVREGLFRITQTLMGVTFKQVPDAHAWHPDVTLYEVREGDRAIGYFYLDLYPRPDKYGHAACFPIVAGMARDGGYQLPVAALVCNFPQPTAETPALMALSDVETFFHEFGHVLHQVLTQAEIHAQAGTNVKMDFVEAPSQIFENWVWNYDALSLFARRGDTGEVFPRELFDRMLASKNAFSGIHTLRQVFLGLVDLTYHTSYDPDGAADTDTVVAAVDRATSVFPPVTGTRFEAGFGHLMGYGANYYGYLYAEVFAADMFSAFEKEGILNAETGARYRREILARGDSADPMTLMRAFLGRDVDDAAFGRSLGIAPR